MYVPYATVKPTGAENMDIIGKMEPPTKQTKGNNMAFNIGEVYRAKSGEILEVMEFTDTCCNFRMRDPKTLEPTEFMLEGPLDGLDGFAQGLKLEKIDLKTYAPTGLTPSSPK